MRVGCIYHKGSCRRQRQALDTDRRVAHIAGEPLESAALRDFVADTRMQREDCGEAGTNTLPGAELAYLGVGERAVSDG